MYVRLLDTEADHTLFATAYHWRDDAPRWFRQCLDIWKEIEEEYFDNLKNELHYGVFENDNFIACIRLIPDQNSQGWFNIHLSVQRGTDWSVIFEAGCTLRDFLFDKGVTGFYGYLPVINKGISKLYECLGFTDTGIRIWKGVVHGKVMEWKHYAVVH